MNAKKTKVETVGGVFTVEQQTAKKWRCNCVEYSRLHKVQKNFECRHIKVVKNG